jgi:hypothetical protein
MDAHGDPAVDRMDPEYGVGVGVVDRGDPIEGSLVEAHDAISQQRRAGDNHVRSQIALGDGGVGRRPDIGGRSRPVCEADGSVVDMRVTPLSTGALFTAIVVGCAAVRPLSEDPLEQGSAGPSGGLDAATGGFDGAPAPGGPVVGPACSADLQFVTDDDGAPIAKCPPDEGCHAGACVPACEAAAKSKGSIGCRFVAATPSFHTIMKSPCFAVFLANAWSRSIKVSVRRGSQTFDATKFARIASDTPDPKAWSPLPASGLPVGKVAVLFLSNDPAATNRTGTMTCPVPPAIGDSTAISDTGRGEAFTIETDAPVSAYDILPFGGASTFLPSAQLLLPTSAWGTNYVAAVPPLEGRAGPQWAQIVASEDDTTVRIAPNRDLPAGPGVAAAKKGAVSTFALSAGEILQWQPTGDISGSVIQSDKPIAFVGGIGYLCLGSRSSSGGGCDSAHQMIAPVSALGRRYVAAPYVTRRKDLAPESIRYRLVGAVDGTSLTYDPPISGAPATLGGGQVVDFESPLPFVVESQDDGHPFHVTQMMSGARVTSGSRPGHGPGTEPALGDEEWVTVLPPRQFLSKYVFFTDPTYATTNVVFVREKGKTGFRDVSLECAGPISGWTPVGSGGHFEVTAIDLVRGGVGNGSCRNGPQVATSDGAFGVVVWGTDSYASYAYPAGGNVGTINGVVLEPGPR